MSLHISKRKFDILESKRGSLLHIETSIDDLEESGRHICSINKKDSVVAALVCVSPELLDLVYELSEDRISGIELRDKANKLITKFESLSPKKI